MPDNTQFRYFDDKRDLKGKDPEPPKGPSGGGGGGGGGGDPPHRGGGDDPDRK